jgi:hypothetical protein
VNVKAGDVGHGKSLYATPALANGNPACVEFLTDRTLRTLRYLQALDVLGFQPFFADDNLKGNFITFVESFESRADDGRVMHEDILAGTLGDKPESLFIVEPLNFAASHIRS